MQKEAETAALVRWSERLLFGLLTLSLVLVAAVSNAPRSPALMPGGVRFVAMAAVPLCLYFILVLAARKGFRSVEAYRTGVLIGVLGGALQSAHMTLAAFGSHIGDQPWPTFTFMGLSFGAWVFAAFRTICSGKSVRDAVLASVFSAMTTMIIAVAYGIVLAMPDIPTRGMSRLGRSSIVAVGRIRHALAWPTVSRQ